MVITVTRYIGSVGKATTPIQLAAYLRPFAATSLVGGDAIRSTTKLAAAEGATSAYADIIGEIWKPYETATAPSATVARKSPAVEMASFKMA
jgi:hypothetical protein